VPPIADAVMVVCPLKHLIKESMVMFASSAADGPSTKISTQLEIQSKASFTATIWFPLPTSLKFSSIQVSPSSNE
jgi:hypothetical protein